jgi:ferric-dicitrate binding protein FerR (iron transport regulator)
LLNTTQEYLKYLLGQEKWTNEEKGWMLNYLDKADLSDLETVAAESYHTDLASLREELDRKTSAGILQKIHRRIDAPRPSLLERMRMYKTSIAAAAIVIIVAGVGYFKLFRTGAANGPDITHTGNPHGPLAGGGHMHQVVTALLERRTVALPDGTQVSLEQGSTLDYPDRFDGKTREIYLDGEAFFEVTKDASHPFIVRTALIKTTVLGTSFNVESYPNREARVVVVTGKVKVEVAAEGKEEREVVITPNYRAVYYVKPDLLEKQEATEEASFCLQRRNGRFNYSGVVVAKVVDDMQRFYHTTLVLQGNVRNRVFNGNIYTTDDLAKALNLISIPLNANIRRDSTTNSYIIYGDGNQ